METPVYESKKQFRSMYQSYCVFCDRIELRKVFLFKTIVIPFSEVEWIDLRNPPVVRTSWWACKLDLADFYPHVGLRRKSGFFKELRFTPDDPEAFVQAVRKLM